jgi:hypothetical protein
MDKNAQRMEQAKIVPTNEAPKADVLDIDISASNLRALEFELPR